MLPTNFDTLVAERPDLGPVLKDVVSWIKSHPDWDIIDTRDLSRSLAHADAWTLATALQLLCDKGPFRQVYMVVTPSGVLADGKYDDPRRIPTRVSDRWNQPFETAEADIVAVLEPRK
jgi:hypothetical protein